jgi:hypothetical protein
MSHRGHPQDLWLRVLAGNDPRRLGHDLGLSCELVDLAVDLALDQVQQVAELGGISVETASLEEQLACIFGTSDVS